MRQCYLEILLGGTVSSQLIKNQSEKLNFDIGTKRKVL